MMMKTDFPSSPAPLARPQLHPDCAPWLRLPLLVGLSGGRDSVALLHLLVEQGCELCACHVHHGIRGAEAEADADFCRELCTSLGVTFRLVEVNVPAQAAAGESMELAARNARYAALIAERERAGAAAVALAHHADDQAETALFRLARGAAGPRAMRAVSKEETGTRPGVWLRPLLLCRREELTAWLQARGLAWRDDATNDDPDCCTRNALRHEVLPALSRAMGRDVIPIIARSARVQADTMEALQEALAQLPLTDPQGRLFLPALEEKSPAFVRAVLFRFLTLAGVPGVDEATLLRLESILPPTAPCARLSLPGGWMALRRHRRLELQQVGVS